MHPADIAVVGFYLVVISLNALIGAVVPPRRNFFPGTSLEIPMPSGTAVAGFLVGWICVALLVLVVYIMARA